MRDLLTVTLATVWVLLVVYLTGRRRHPREVPDDIDREFRDLVQRMSLMERITPREQDIWRL